MIVSKPRNDKAIPSTIHSIVIINLLSVEMSPKFLTTLDVGNKCEIPQSNVKAAAM